MAGGTSSKTIIVGNLGADPELKYMPNGDAVLNLGVATSISWKDKNSGESRSETEWHRCVFFRKLAENVAQYLKKGAKVYIMGRNRTRKWDDNGTDRYTTEIIVSEVEFLDKAPGKKDSSQSVNAKDAAQQIDNQEIPFDDDIPF